MLPTLVKKSDSEIVEFVPFCEILMDQSCQKRFLVLTHLSFQTYTGSTPSSSVPFIKVSISIAVYLKRTARF